MTFPIAEDAEGNRKAWNGQAWVDMPNKNAPGAAYITPTVGKPDKSEAAYFRTLRDKDNVTVAAARTGVARARRAEGLLERQKTGGIYAVPVLGSVAGAFDPEIRELDAIQAEVARSKRQPGEGAISDFDAQQFLSMTYGKDKPTETNRALIQAQRIADDAAIQRRQFLEWHYNTTGSVSGAEEAWDRYAQDNPIFSPESERRGSPTINSGRQNWRQYFGLVRSGGDARQTQAHQDAAAKAKRPAVPMAARQAAARLRAQGVITQTGAFGSQSNPYVARDEKVLERLSNDPKQRGKYVITPRGDLAVIE